MKFDISCYECFKRCVCFMHSALDGCFKYIFGVHFLWQGRCFFLLCQLFWTNSLHIEGKQAVYLLHFSMAHSYILNKFFTSSFEVYRMISRKTKNEQYFSLSYIRVPEGKKSPWDRGWILDYVHFDYRVKPTLLSGSYASFVLCKRPNQKNTENPANDVEVN